MVECYAYSTVHTNWGNMNQSPESSDRSKRRRVSESAQRSGSAQGSGQNVQWDEEDLRPSASVRTTGPSANIDSNNGVSGDEFHRKNAQALMAKAECELKQRQVERSSPTQWPMVVGIFDFPFRLSTFPCWLSVSFGLIISSFLFSILLGPIGSLGTIVIRLIGPAAAGTMLFTLAYMFHCCLKVIEQTAYGHAVIDDWPPFVMWKEWGWAFFQLLLVVMQSALVAAILTAGSWLYSPTPVVVMTAILFPWMLLSSLEADSWIPYSKPIMRSLLTHLPIWGLFYLEVALVVAAWGLLSIGGFMLAGAWSLLVSAPLFAAACLICARLLGRLAWCLRRP